MHSIIVHANPDSPEASACNTIFDNGVPHDARQIYTGARNTLYEVPGPETPFCVKHFRHAKFPNSYVYTTFRRSKARRSYEHACQLLQLGFDTPRPIAWAEHRKGLKLCDSYYICQYVPLPNVRFWGTAPDADTLIEALGAYMVELHRAGVYHRDFSPGNILVDRRPDHSYHFSLVDINRMEFGVTDNRRLMSMFRSISLDHNDTRRLAQAYARAAGLDPDNVVAQALKSLDDYLATKRRHNRLKQLLHLKK